MEYTVEVYKLDKRTKSGVRAHRKFDITINSPLQTLRLYYETIYPMHKGYRVRLHETFVTRKNLLSGEEFTERYDTPFQCSPASETFWSA